MALGPGGWEKDTLCLAWPGPSVGVPVCHSKQPVHLAARWAPVPKVSPKLGAPKAQFLSKLLTGETLGSQARSALVPRDPVQPRGRGLRSFRPFPRFVQQVGFPSAEAASCRGRQKTPGGGGGSHTGHLKSPASQPSPFAARSCCRACAVLQTFPVLTASPWGCWFEDSLRWCSESSREGQ